MNTLSSPAVPVKALVVASDCNPEWISVALEGWSHAWALRSHANVHLVTHINNKPAIDKTTWPREEVTYIELGVLDRIYRWLLHDVFKLQWGKVGLTAAQIPFYWAFEFAVIKSFRARLAKGEFELVHRLTPVSPVKAGPLAGFCGRRNVPFVYGPINGGLAWPKGYENASEKEREWLTSLRGLFHFLPFVRSTRRHARGIIAGSKTAIAQTPEKFRDKTFYVPENAIAAKDIPPAEAAAPTAGPLRLAFLGRLVPYKGCDMALRGAANHLRTGKAVMDVMGDGIERPFLEKLAKDLGIAHAVTFHGMVPHAKALAILKTADLFTFPSIREFGGAVVVEAMAQGLVPIVVGYGGPDEMVDDAVGYKLPLTSAEDTARRIDETLAKVFADRDHLAQQKVAARAHVRQHWTWDAKAARTYEIYRYVARQAPKPTYAP